MKEKKTTQFTSGDIDLIPYDKGAVVFLKKKKIIDLGLEDAQSLMICFLDLANAMMPAPPVVTGKKLPRTSKHAK